MERFSVIISSDICRDLYSTNNNSQFKNKLPQSLIFEDENNSWKIALQSIFIDASFSNVPQDVANVDKHILIYTRNDFTAKKQPSGVITIENNLYTIQDLVFELESKKPLFPPENNVTPEVVFSVRNSLLMIETKYCFLLVHKNLCRWLGITIERSRVPIQGYEDYIFFYSGESIPNTKKELDKTIFPKLIKVKADEISRGIPDNKKDIAIFSYEESKNNNKFFYIPIKKEYFNVNNRILEELTITLVDENDIPLRLVKGRPTIIQFILKKMNSNSFIVRFNSSESKQMYPENRRGNFEMQLPNTVDLIYQQWNVAMTSLYIPADIAINHALTKENFWIEFVSVENKSINEKIYFDDVIIEDSKTLIECINRKTKAVIGDATFVCESIDNKARIKFFKPMVVRFSNMLNYVIGRDITIHDEIIIRRASSISFTKEIDVTRCRSNIIFVHCNFISPTIIGNNFANVLKIVPFKKGKYECKHLDYINVASNNLSSIQIQLLDIEGKEIIFENEPNNDVIITVVFQRRN
jgi:hypothetical protein